MNLGPAVRMSPHKSIRSTPRLDINSTPRNVITPFGNTRDGSPSNRNRIIFSVDRAKQERPSNIEFTASSYLAPRSEIRPSNRGNNGLGIEMARTNLLSRLQASADKSQGNTNSPSRLNIGSPSRSLQYKPLKKSFPLKYTPLSPIKGKRKLYSPIKLSEQTADYEESFEELTSVVEPVDPITNISKPSLSSSSDVDVVTINKESQQGKKHKGVTWNNEVDKYTFSDNSRSKIFTLDHGSSSVRARPSDSLQSILSPTKKRRNTNGKSYSAVNLKDASAKVKFGLDMMKSQLAGANDSNCNTIFELVTPDNTVPESASASAITEIAGLSSSGPISSGDSEERINQMAKKIDQFITNQHLKMEKLEEKMDKILNLLLSNNE